MIAHLHPGGDVKAYRIACQRTALVPFFWKPDSIFKPPHKGRIPMQCESCGADFAPHPMAAWRSRFSKCAPKRFCSEKCRKREETRRYRQRMREADNAE